MRLAVFAEFRLAPAYRYRRAPRFTLSCGFVRHSKWLAFWLAAVAIVASCHEAAAHGIAGNRYFAGTLTFDDPAVADEAILPLYSAINYPAPGGNVAENRITWAFDRLLTPTLAVTYESGWIHQNWPIGKTSGLETTTVGLKYEAYRDNRHEALVSVGGASVNRERKRSTPTSPTPFSRASSLARDLAIYPIGSPGHGLSPSLARLWMQYRRAQLAKRSPPMRRPANSKPTSCRKRTCCIGAFRCNTAHTI